MQDVCRHSPFAIARNLLDTDSVLASPQTVRKRRSATARALRGFARPAFATFAEGAPRSRMRPGLPTTRRTAGSGAVPGRADRHPGWLGWAQRPPGSRHSVAIGAGERAEVVEADAVLAHYAVRCRGGHLPDVE